MTPSCVCIQGFVDDLGNLIIPYWLDFDSYIARYYFYREEL